MLLRTRFLLTAVLLGIFLSLTANSRADAPDPLGASLGLTQENKSVPLWSKSPKEVDQQLAQTARNLLPAVMLVGNPGYKKGEDTWSTSGTAFVISRKNRLIATNAHVADSYRETGGKLFAVRNGSSVVYTVDHAPWYHPGVKRTGSDGLVHQDANPAVGDVFTWSADVAVMHLAEGPELPAEMTFATADELNCAFLGVGMMGFPAYATERSPDKFHWPNTDNGELAVADFRSGVINRITDFHNRAGAPLEDLQYLHHSLESWHGFSGSAIFLPNGHVVGLNNSGAQSKDSGRSVPLSYGVRVDCLWELLVYHQLDGLVSIPVDKSKLLVEKHIRPDPEDLATNHKVDLLIQDSQELSRLGKYRSALEKCAAALELAPTHAPIYDQRFRVIQNYANQIANSNEVTQDAKLDLHKAAMESAKMALQLSPTDPAAYVNLCIARMDLDHFNTGSFKNADCVEILTEVLAKDQGLDPEFRAEVYRFRGQARGFDDEALADMNEAVRIAPFLWRSFDHRARYFRLRDPARADADDRRAEQLRAVDLVAHRAWNLATSPDPAQRNGTEAIKFAKQACEATNYQYYRWIAALAASYAESGDFTNAVAMQSKVLELVAPCDRSKAQARFELYKSGKPYHSE